MTTNEIRPADFALFLLASGDLMPRKRARDQQADVAGLDLLRRVLDMLVSYDPDPADVEGALMRIVAEIGPPHGPTRAVAASVRDEWQDAAATPEFVAWLIEQAVDQDRLEREGRRGKKQHR
jgi:hypothetical protein